MDGRISSRELIVPVGVKVELIKDIVNTIFKKVRKSLI